MSTTKTLQLYQIAAKNFLNMLRAEKANPDFGLVNYHIKSGSGGTAFADLAGLIYHCRAACAILAALEDTGEITHDELHAFLRDSALVVQNCKRVEEEGRKYYCQAVAVGEMAQFQRLCREEIMDEFSMAGPLADVGALLVGTFGKLGGDKHLANTQLYALALEHGDAAQQRKFKVFFDNNMQEEALVIAATIVVQCVNSGALGTDVIEQVFGDSCRIIQSLMEATFLESMKEMRLNNDE